MNKDNALDLALEALEDRSSLMKCQKAITAIKQARSAPTVQEPNYWNVIDPAGNIVASETDAIRGWARIAGSYKPTVEGLLGFHDQGWRVLPKVSTSAAQRQWVGLTDEEFEDIELGCRSTSSGKIEAMQKVEAKLKEKNT